MTGIKKASVLPEPVLEGHRKRENRTLQHRVDPFPPKEQE